MTFVSPPGHDRGPIFALASGGKARLDIAIRFRGLSVVVLSAILCACDNDTGVTAFNALPEASITAPSEGEILIEGELVALRGRVSDADDDVASLLATWFVGTETLCDTAPPDADGVTTCEAVFGPDDTLVTLEVVDPGDAAGSASVAITVTPTDAPVAAILAPDAAGTFYSDQKITFEGLVSDTEDDPTALVAWWESDLDGVLDVAAEPDSEGATLGSGLLSEGEHFLTLTAEDPSGKTGADSVVLAVGPPNQPPTCTITAPEDSISGSEGDLVTLEALVEDPDVPADWLAVTWESDRDGELATSTPNSDGTVGFSTRDLSVNTHVLSLTVADEVGGSCRDSIYYTVGTPPEAEITSPVDGETVGEGATATFAALVSDNEDQPTALAVSWVSDLDGELSTEGADSSGELTFSTSALSAGDHAVSLTVTDTDGLYAVERVNLSVNGLPTAPTVTISPDPALTDDDLTASASDSTDPEGSTVTYSYAWYEAGTLSTASTSSVFPASATAKVLSYKVVVTPSDGTHDGPTGEAERVVDNTEPELTSVSISPSTGVTSSDTLTCSGSATDVDGDTPSLAYSWTDGDDKGVV